MTFPIKEHVTPKGELTIPLVFVPGGEFIMGSDDPRAGEHERPRRISVLPPFWIGRTVVTEAQWEIYCRSTARDVPFSFGPDYPVDEISWHEALAFCTWAGLSLQTSAEWEKAARGTDGRSHPWGEGSEIGVREIDFPGRPVTDLACSPFGALGMGDIREWCLDEIGEDRVIRGGYALLGRIGPNDDYAQASASEAWGIGARNPKHGTRGITFRVALR